MFQPHPSNPILYRLTVHKNKTIYGNFNEILKKIKKLGFKQEEFLQNGPDFFYKQGKAGLFGAEIEIAGNNHLWDCIGPNCKRGYKFSIVSALCRQWNLKESINPSILQQALKIEDDFRRTVFLSKYKKVSKKV